MAQHLGPRIVELRRSRGLTQERLATAAGLKSKGYLSRIERGERLPSLAVLERLAQSLDVEIRDLMIYPETSDVDRAMDLIRSRGPEFARRMVEWAAAAPAQSRPTAPQPSAF